MTPIIARQITYGTQNGTVKSPRASDTQQGFSLLEALICVVLITMAFLGSAGLHLASLRDTQTSGQVTQASQLAGDLSERIRANFRSIDLYTTIPAGLVSSCNTTTGCTAAEMVANDLAEWNSELLARLPNGGGIVCRDVSPSDGASPTSSSCSGGATDPIAIKIWWTLRDQTSAGGPVASTQRQVLAFIPRP
jgi:type IV pilus assembly protein PilV